MKQKILSSAKIGMSLPTLEFDISEVLIRLGAMATRDVSPLHHDKDYAVNKSGHKNIFMNTPTLMGLFERYIADWAGCGGRLGRIRFKMKSPVYPEDKLIVCGTVKNASQGQLGIGWIDIDLSMRVKKVTVVEGWARIALPIHEESSVWKVRKERWVKEL